MTHAKHQPAGQATLRLETLNGEASVAGVLDALGGEQSLSVLESTATHPTRGRYSLVGCRPADVLTLRDGKLTDARGALLHRTHDRPDPAFWEILDARLSAVRCPRRDDLPYCPGWIGYVGYEVGRLAEKLPARAARDTDLPDLRLARHDALLIP